jgi:hypothetical protein
MTGRDLVDYILDERGIRLTIGAPTCVSFDQHFRQDWGALIDKKIAEARAEALRDAAGVLYRVEQELSCLGHRSIAPGMESCSQLLLDVIQLRAAITQEEV